MNSIGIDVGGTNLRTGLVNPQGHLLELKKEPTPQGRDAVIKTLTRMIHSLKELSKDPVAGVGLGWPGPVDRKRGLIHQSPNLEGFNEFPIASALSQATGLRCLIDNDAKCAGLGEWQFGAAQGMQTFVVLTFGTGIGGVVFSEGHLVYGKTGGAGEIGHMTLHPQGENCTCGNKGCFERYCSAKALERKAEKLFGREIGAREIVSASEKNEAWATDIILDFTEDLALAVASLTNLFDPEAFIFSGGLFTTGGGPILKHLKEKIKTRCFESFQKDMKLIPSELHGTAGIVGAASLIWLADRDPKSQQRL